MAQRTGIWTHGSGQFIQPGDSPLLVENPYQTQPAHFSIHVLPELVPGVDADLQPQAAEIQNQRFAQFQQEGNAVTVSAENAKAEDVWIEEGLPLRYRSRSPTAHRGLGWKCSSLHKANR